MCVDCAGDLVTLWRNVETGTGWLQAGDWGQSGEITRTGAKASQGPDYAKHREQKQIGPKDSHVPTVMDSARKRRCQGLSTYLKEAGLPKRNETRRNRVSTMTCQVCPSCVHASTLPLPHPGWGGGKWGIIEYKEAIVIKVTQKLKKKEKVREPHVLSVSYWGTI